MKDGKLRVVELFGGLGAQACALERLGIDFESVYCDIDENAYKAYCAIHGPTENLGDITKVEHLPECDLLTYSWPCLRGDSLVLTDKGWKEIKDIVVGDMVETDDGMRKVTASAMTGIKRVRNISHKCGMPIACTGTHPFLAKETVDMEPHYIIADELKPGYLIGHPISDTIIPGWDKKKEIVSKGWVWSEIVSNVPDSDITIPVYDITVEDRHCFNCNGIIVKNCTSISLAGKREGMKEGSGTASSLLWEVGRLLDDMKERGCLPEVLVSENVDAVMNRDNKPLLDKWIVKLNQMGYTTSYSILNAKDYGIPQNRRRHFMVSTLHMGEFIFPEPRPLELRLKDMLEDDVPESFYLSDERIAKYERHRVRQEENHRGFGWKPLDADSAPTSNCLSGTPVRHASGTYLKEKN